MAAQLALVHPVPVVKEVGGAERLVAVGPVHHTVGGVGAALGHQLHLRGRGASLVSIVVGGGDTEFLQGSLGGADGAGEGEAELGVVDVHAVEGDVGLVAAGAVDAAAAAVKVHNAAVAARVVHPARYEGHPRLQTEQTGRVKVGGRKVENLGAGNWSPHAGVHRVNAGDSLFHQHLFGNCADFQRDIQRGGDAHRQGNGVLHLGFEPLHADFQPILGGL